MPESQQLPKTIEEPVAPPLAHQQFERFTRVEPPSRPPDRRLVVVHNFQWHLIIRAFALLILALAVVL